jgi:hypothetical protein
MKKICVLLIFLGILGVKIQAQSSISSAQAVFVYNFTRLIEWPAEYKTGDFVITVFGTSDIFTELRTYTNAKLVGSQNISLQKANSVEEIGKCQIVFVSFARTKDLPAIIDKIGSNSTLIIAERRGAIDSGAAINFLVIEDKLRFELKTSNATRNKLKVHSNLENMAATKY